MILHIRTLVLTGVALFASVNSAQAATVATEVFADANGKYNITYKNQPFQLMVNPSTVDNSIWFYAGNPIQGPTDIASQLAAVYDVAANSLTAVAKCDGSCSAGATMTPKAETGSGSVSTFTSTNAFNYLALHVGDGELYFAWALPINAFTLTGMTTESMSNYQAFSGPVLATPLPAAALMFGSALLGMLGFKRRAKRDTRSPVAPQIA